MNVKKKKALALTALILAILFMVVIFIFVGRPLVKMVSSPEAFRAWVNDLGVWSRIAFVGMVAFQVIIAIIPGEPFEIGAGYAFGAVEGTLLCLGGALIGGAIVFVCVKRFGRAIAEIFFSAEKLDSIKLLGGGRKVELTLFFVMMVPGTPKDLITYGAGLTGISFPHWILLSTVARIPSVLSSAIGGSALGSAQYEIAVITFVLTLAVSILGIVLYRTFERKRAAKKQENDSCEQ